MLIESFATIGTGTFSTEADEKDVKLAIIVAEISGPRGRGSCPGGLRPR